MDFFLFFLPVTFCGSVICRLYSSPFLKKNYQLIALQILSDLHFLYFFSVGDFTSDLNIVYLSLQISAFISCFLCICFSHVFCQFKTEHLIHNSPSVVFKHITHSANNLFIDYLFAYI